jgi:type I restriction enzyme, R subunit
MYSNFKFLEKEHPLLANLGILAEKYIHDDPNTALFKMRLLGEKMVETIFFPDAITILME